jgi:hypothetical protein
MKINWMIDRLIPEGAIIMFAGKRASFKSWLADHMAICLAKGEPYLGFHTNSQHTSLIIDVENNPIMLSERLNQLQRNEKTLILKDETFRWEKHSEWLLDYCKTNNIKLVINDTFRRSHDADENDAGEISSLFQTHLQKFKDAGITLLLLYHLRKGLSGMRTAEMDLMDELRGSSELVNLPDVIFVIDRKRGSNTAIIHQVKNRFAQELDPLAVEVNIHETVTFNTSIAVEESIVNICAKQLLKFMRSTERDTYKCSELREWANRNGFGRSGFMDSLKLLCQLQLLEKPHHGFYKAIKDQQQVQQFLDA